MNVRPASLAEALARAQALERTVSTVRPGAGGASGSTVGKAAGAGGGFGEALKGAIDSVSQAQNASSELQKRFQMEDPTANLEQVMVQMNRSQVAFQAAVTVRNRLVSAYTDIMNMQV